MTAQREELVRAQAVLRDAASAAERHMMDLQRVSAAVGLRLQRGLADQGWQGTSSDVLNACAEPFLQIVGVIAEASGAIESAITTEIDALVRVTMRPDPPVPPHIRYTRPPMSHDEIKPGATVQSVLPDCSWHAAIAALQLTNPRQVATSVRRDHAAGTVTVTVGYDSYVLEDSLPASPLTKAPRLWLAEQESMTTRYLRKAWAVEVGDVHSSTHPNLVLTWFTGEAADWKEIAELSDDELRQLASDATIPLVVGSRSKPTTLAELARWSMKAYLYNVVPGHAYTVTAHNRAGFHLRNPWGRKHPQPLPIAALRELFEHAFWIDSPRLKSARRVWADLI